MEVPAARKRRVLVRSLYYILYNWFYKPVLKLYLRSDSNITFDGFNLKVFKDVFHPKLFFSTTYFYSFLKKQALKDKTFLEVGCGSGILSLLACRMGAKVTALDVDPKAVKNTSLNFHKNFPEGSPAVIIESDVFERLTAQAFDVIAINPPYYFKKVEADTQLAWYCGEDGEYFKKLFSGLPHFMSNDSSVFMILEENCDLDRIESLATPHGIYFEMVEEKIIRWEKNYIFKLSDRQQVGATQKKDI